MIFYFFCYISLRNLFMIINFDIIYIYGYYINIIYIFYYVVNCIILNNLKVLFNRYMNVIFRLLFYK